MTSVATVLGIKLREKREELKLSQATVAKTLDMTNAGWGKLEKGINALSVDKLISVCELFEIKPSTLMKEVESEIEELKKTGWDVSSRRIAEDDLLTGLMTYNNPLAMSLIESYCIDAIYKGILSDADNTAANLGVAISAPRARLIGIAADVFQLTKQLKQKGMDDYNEK